MKAAGEVLVLKVLLATCTGKGKTGEVSYLEVVLLLRGRRENSCSRGVWMQSVLSAKSRMMEMTSVVQVSVLP